jgi:hypothetical protein
MLSNQQIASFIKDGYLCLDQVFPKELAAECRDILWRDTGCDPGDMSTWKRPVVWLWAYAQEPFVRAANAPRLLSAYDQLVGQGRWVPMRSLGTFPIRFPTDQGTEIQVGTLTRAFPGKIQIPMTSCRGGSTSIPKGALYSRYFYSLMSVRPTRRRVFALALTRVLQNSSSLQETMACPYGPWMCPQQSSARKR